MLKNKSIITVVVWFYPFADTNFYVPSYKEDKGYYLVVTRLVEYKRIDIAVQTFNELGLPLVIVGEGRELANLKKMAKDNISFKGWCTNRQIKEYYQDCKAFIFPGERGLRYNPR